MDGGLHWVPHGPEKTAFDAQTYLIILLAGGRSRRNLPGLTCAI
jgi:hypothetical protein